VKPRQGIFGDTNLDDRRTVFRVRPLQHFTIFVESVKGAEPLPGQLDPKNVAV
jgi:hypothetical protein